MEKKKPEKVLPEGDSYVWLTSLGLTVGLTMVTVILLYIVWQGVAAFWPADVVQIKIKEGSDSRVMGGEYLAGELISEIENTVDDGKEVKTFTENQYYIANRDLFNLSFRFVKVDDIEETTTPEDIMIIERLSDSKALFYPEKIVLEDGKEVAFKDAAFQKTLDDLMHKNDKLHDEIHEIQVGPIADVIKKNKYIRVDQYAFRREMRRDSKILRPYLKFEALLDKLDKSFPGYMAMEKADKEVLEKHSPELVQLVKDYQVAQQELAAVGGDFYKQFMALQTELEKGQVEEKNLVTKVDALQKELNKTKMVYRTASGPTGEVSMGNVLHYYYPNQLGTGGKIGLFFSNAWNFLTEEPRHANTEGGIFPAIVGTLMMTILMCIFVTPFGVIAAIFLREYATQGPVVRVVRIAINNLAGVPSIVYGAFGMAFFIYTIGHSLDEMFYSDWVDSGNGAFFGTGGMLWASLTLALLTVPVVIVATEEALAAVPRGIREGSLGCGASKWQMIRTVVLPACAPGIITGMILAMARGAGEVAPLMLVGVADIASELPIDTIFPFGVEKKFMHLGYNIYHVGFKTPDSEAAKPLVFATTLLLIVIVFVLNMAGIIIRQRLRKKYASGAF